MPVLKNPKWEALAQAVVKVRARHKGHGVNIWAAIAKEAGYSGRPNACKAARKPLVAARIRELQERVAERAEISQAKYVAILDAIASADALDYAPPDSRGLPMPNFKGLTKEQRAALAEITVDQLDIVRDGKTGKETTRIRWKLHDKLGAIDKIARLMKWYEERHVHSGPDGGPLLISWLTEAEAKARGLG